MSDISAVLKRCKRPLIGLGVSIVLAAASLSGAHYALDALQAQAQSAAAAAQALQDQVNGQESDLQNVQTHIQRFEQLRAQGLMGDAQRVVWMEQLHQAFAETGLAQQLRMELMPAQALTGAGDGTDGTAVVLTHDLTFELNSALETDVLQALERFKHAVTGRFRVQECRFSDATAEGVLVRCTLRFVTIAEPPAAPTVP